MPVRHQATDVLVILARLVCMPLLYTLPRQRKVFLPASANGVLAEQSSGDVKVMCVCARACAHRAYVHPGSAVLEAAVAVAVAV